MKKLVYLHELDSVRTSKAGIEHGLSCLFEEIVKNGNYVALTMNQLADSKIILSAIQNEEDFNYILRLFEKGVIRISRYKVKDKETKEEIEIRTPAQYMLGALRKNICKAQEQLSMSGEVEDSFITSALPIKHNDIELMKILYNAIKYSDPDFVRVECEKISFLDNVEKKKEVIEYLCTYVEFILSVSRMQFAGNPPKEQKAFIFTDFMKELERFPVDKWFAKDAVDSLEREIYRIYSQILTVRDSTQRKTILTLAGEYASKKSTINRSNWHNYFSPEQDESSQASKDFKDTLSNEEMLFAEMLVDLCYNYTVEESVLNISLHYRNFDDKESLQADIKERIKRYCHEMKKGIYSPRTEESTEYIAYPRNEIEPNWDISSRVIVKEASDVSGKVYEEDFHKEQKEWKRKLQFTILRNIGIALFYIIVFCVADWLTGYVQEMIAALLSEQISNSLIVSISINLVLFTIIFSIINSLLSDIIHLPDIVESMKAIGLGFRDSHVVRRVRELAYRRRKQ